MHSKHRLQLFFFVKFVEEEARQHGVDTVFREADVEDQRCLCDGTTTNGGQNHHRHHSDSSGSSPAHAAAAPQSLEKLRDMSSSHSHSRSSHSISHSSSLSLLLSPRFRSAFPPVASRFRFPDETTTTTRGTTHRDAKAHTYDERTKHSTDTHRRPR